MKRIMTMLYRKCAACMAVASLVMLTAACSSSDDNMLTDGGKTDAPDALVTPIKITANYGTTRVAYTEDGYSISATWDAEDQMYVVYDGKVNLLSLTDGAGTATATFSGTISGSPKATSILICYVKDKNNPSAVTVSTNGEYTYQSGAFTGQDGTLAGAAKCNLYYGTATYGTGEDIACSFSVNTSILKFSVRAAKGIKEGDAATLTYKSDGETLAQVSYTVGAKGHNVIYMAVPAGQYTGEQTLQFESGDADETRTLSATKAAFTAGQTYSKGFNFSVNEAAANGIFTINDEGDEIYFAKGNLQYQASTGTWRFAQNQYDYIGKAPGNNTATGRETQADWIDLFGWGTRDNPYNASTANEDYSWHEWGEATSLVATYGSGWRTLSYDEWDYILNTRESGSTVNGVDNARYTYATVNTDGKAVKGVILFPDDFIMPATAVTTWGNINNESAWGTKCTTVQWRLLSEHGAVFLPAAGKRNNTSPTEQGDKVQLWTSTTIFDGNASYLTFAQGEAPKFTNRGNLNVGYAVRLAHTAE